LESKIKGGVADPRHDFICEILTLWHISPIGSTFKSATAKRH